MSKNQFPVVNSSIRRVVGQFKNGNAMKMVKLSVGLQKKYLFNPGYSTFLRPIYKNK